MLHRVEVRAKPGHTCPEADNAQKTASMLGLDSIPQHIEYADVYLIEADLTREQVGKVANELLADPVTQHATIGAGDPRGDAYIEVQPLAGVMDPNAASIELAIRAALGVDARVQTGRRYDLFGVDQDAAASMAERALANTVIHAIHSTPFLPDHLPMGSERESPRSEIPLRDLDDAALRKLSREAHLFLSLEEMRAIQHEYRALGREPREIELETLAQTWSEHCVHKTLKSTIRYREVSNDQSPRNASHGLSIKSMRGRPGHTMNDDGSVTIDNLLRSTIAAATRELMEDGIDWCLSVFVDNAGVIAFDDTHAVCFKVETHNHPSAIEPYGGAATGIGGCIRDIIGTGLAAKPIASTDVFCVAYPDHWSQSPRRARRGLSAQVRQLPAGCLHPRRILTQVVAGVRDYGNRMGIPTLNGAVWFDDRYVGNPLVFCGSVGVMPRDKVTGEPSAGDHIIALGGRTGRDGIHGATFSSAELTDTHADEFAHAVQIGNPVTEKMMLDVILHARDHPDGCLFNAITDCGAGGFSSAVGEMGAALGAVVNIERAPLKYAGLTPTEIWISEAQERMVLAVPPEKIETLRALCNTHGVEMSDLGEFGSDDRELILMYDGTEVGRLSMAFLHDGLPRTEREAVWTAPIARSAHEPRPPRRTPDLEEALLALLAHPNIASKHWIIRQYDHEVQGNSVVKPLTGPRADGPSDAAVILPVAGSTRGLAIANGLATALSDDPYVMAMTAVDECVRNLVCVGADPDQIAILDNFCWPGCDDPATLGALVQAAEGCYDAANAYRTPFISGKDSLNNQFTTEESETIEIPPTLLLSGFGIVPDVTKCVTMDAKRTGNLLAIVGGTRPVVRGSHLEMCFGTIDDDESSRSVDLSFGPAVARCISSLIGDGIVASAHDISDGGMLCAIAEMCMAGNLGMTLDGFAEHFERPDSLPPLIACFGEGSSSYLIEISPDSVDSVMRRIAEHGLGEDTMAIVGTFNDSGRLTLGTHLDVSIETLRSAWRGTLDW